MTTDLLSLRRRNVHERKALRLLRGEIITPSRDTLAWRRAHIISMDDGTLGEYSRAHFGSLREFAYRNGLEIRPSGSQYLTAGELVMLRWLAEAQRQNGLRTCHFRDIGLKTSLRHCASLLKEFGVFLPHKTLHISSDLDDAPSVVNGLSSPETKPDNHYRVKHFRKKVVYRRSMQS